MKELEEKILNTIIKYNLIEKGDNVVIGVSGGPDSMTLLNVLNNMKQKLEIEICVAHVNHMIREEAESETQYVIDFCKKNNIECFVKRIDVTKQAEKLRISTELAGREIRYQFFEEILQKVKGNKIATAHNANDNAETVLMNIMRGSGTSGLKGIEKIRDGKFIRPIIECNRKEIEKYCKENQLDPKYDKTNEENIYTRNKIRNLLIPYIEKEFNPNIVETLNRLSTIATKEDAFFHKVVESEFKKLNITANNNLKDVRTSIAEDCEENRAKENKTIILDLKNFNLLDDVIKSRIILYTINKLLGNTQGIEKIHIEDIIKLCGNNIGNKFLTPNKNIKIFVKKGKIFFIDKT